MNRIHHHNYVPTLFAGSLSFLTILSALVLSSPSSHADTSGSVTLSVDVPSNCSLTVYPDHHSVTIEHNHTGTIGTSNIKSICNDPSGLAVYAVGYTDNTYGNTNLTATVGNNTYNIASHATPSGTPAQSEWNMTLSPVSGDYVPNIVTGFDSAHAIPNVYTKVAYRNTMTDIGENATGAQFNATFNAYIDTSQATGTYTGLVKFLLVHPNVLTYNSQTGQPETVQPTVMACNPETPSLQDVSTWGNSVTSGQSTVAIDSRDCKEYTVARLGTQLWMTENLKFDISTHGDQITIDNTDHPSSEFVTAASSKPASSSDGFTFANVDFIKYNTSNLGIGTTGCSTTNTPCETYGVYYNWYTATAGTGKNVSNSNASGSLCPAGWRLPTGNTGGEFETLNTNVNSGSTSSISGLLSSPANFVYSGFYNDSDASYRGSRGYYWSGMAAGSVGAYDFEFGSGAFVALTNNAFRSYGLTVRCITDS